MKEMPLLKTYIAECGKLLSDDILKVDTFLNYQLDAKLYKEIALELYSRFKNKKIDKIMTVETSGIALAIMLASLFEINAIYAKKHGSLITNDEIYSTSVYSFTHQKNYNMLISKHLLKEDEHVLLVDDFLANGEAVKGMIDLCKQAKAQIEGIGIIIEKSYQRGKAYLEKLDYELESLIHISKIDYKEKKIHLLDGSIIEVKNN